ncbi:CapA family protein [Leptospira gomenensis]|uniref:CapA family protein n=1 Tax=Leptospira gomenensis TaxID=2484974 RepID=A0A5F1YS47_9LEPT|nr:CapA family protein [Leptospira gomenensis]TGK33791.1 CapA family protein [Leptospira gomenensis]TGK36360.1 CapA family protein [Leptospira gomenensis]TGK47384.1 CapA family protein [Leptospira gomenensis]TGK60667.1 CapA family protein [Leptospira gomenensis]
MKLRALYSILSVFLLFFFILPLGSEEKTTVTIKAVGDMVPGTNFPEPLSIQDPRSFLFGKVERYLKGADMLFGNFESTLTNYPNTSKDTSRRMIFAFRTPPAYAKVLKEVGFDILSIANNHSLDFHQQGFDDTQKNLSDVGIRYTGKKGMITYMNVKNVSIAWIGFSHLKSHNNVNEIEEGVALVKEAKRKAQLVFISFHGGAEGGPALHVKNQMERFYGEYRGNLVEFSHSLIDAGADLVIGHGPHLVRAMELYKGRLIAYSLGNFMGYRALSSRGIVGYSLVLEAEVDSEGKFVKGKIIPLQLDSASIPEYDPDKKTIDLMRKLTKEDFPGKGPKIAEDGTILP